MSTREQAEEGNSIEGQHAACRDYCDKRGYYVARIFRDRVSGRDGERPAFQRMIEVASRGGFDVLVVWKRDRYFRNAIEAGFYERVLGKFGVRIEDVARGPVDDSPAARFTTLVLDGAAELERAFIAERCAMGRKMAAEAGLWPTAPFYGYRKAEASKASRLEIVWEEAQKVREAYMAVLRGGNKHHVAAIFGINPRSVGRRLHNPAYKGLADYAGIKVPVPAIVPEDVWQRVQDELAKRYRQGSPS